MPNPEMVIFTDAIPAPSAKCYQVPLVKLKVGPPESNAVVEGKYMVHLGNSLA